MFLARFFSSSFEIPSPELPGSLQLDRLNRDLLALRGNVNAADADGGLGGQLVLILLLRRWCRLRLEVARADPAGVQLFPGHVPFVEADMRLVRVRVFVELRA